MDLWGFRGALRTTAGHSAADPFHLMPSPETPKVCVESLRCLVIQAVRCLHLEKGKCCLTETGIRDLTAHLSSYLREVEEGRTVVITRHGKPIARIVPVTVCTEAQLDTQQQAGLITWEVQRLEPLAPVGRTRGKRTVAELLLEDRG